MKMTCADRMQALGCAVLIPTYNNERTIAQVIDDVRLYCRDVLVVNDGSTDLTRQILARRNDIQHYDYVENRGKGYALKLGFRKAQELGFRYLITIDADAQHYADDIPHFIDRIEQSPDTLIIGARNLTAENMPGKNTFANKFSNFWYQVETAHTLTDTQSGYRLYPIERLAGMRFVTPRYEFEVEVLVRAAWRGIPVVNIPVKVFYPDASQRVSHFRPLRDFTRISILNTFLVTIALLYYYPLLFFRSLNPSTLKGFIDKHIIHTKESNARIAGAVGLGLFCGIIPLWGYQMIFAGVVAHLLKLSKFIAIAASNISIPPMIPLILYGSLFMGGLLIGSPTWIPLREVTFETVAASLFQYVIGSIALAVVCGLIGGVVTYFILRCSKRKCNG